MIKKEKSYNDYQIFKFFNPNKKDGFNRFLLIFIPIFLLISTSYFLIRWQVNEEITYIGMSMNPTLVDSNNYTFKKIFFKLKRGDIVMYKYQDKEYINRIVALPTEKILFNYNNTYLVKQGDKLPQLLTEPYLSKDGNGAVLPTCAQPNCTYQYDELMLGTEEYYLLGDNRSNAFDSRTHGSVKKVDIIGVK